jgi:two-component system, LuxR family, sensor kinase FixL
LHSSILANVNLMRNAVEAMQDSDVRELDIATRALGDEMVEIWSATPARGLLRKSWRACLNRSTPPRKLAMGVGLSISCTIVEAHGGRLLAEKNSRGDTTFSMTVQAASPSLDQTA